MRDPLRKKSTQQKFEIVRLIRSRGRVSRQQISERFGIALPTVSALVRDLQARGLVRPEGHRRSTGGRPPEVLGIEGDYGVAIGAEIRHGRVAAALVNARGEILSEEVGGEAVGLDAHAALAAFDRCLKTLFGALAGRRLLGVGVGVSGTVENGNLVSRHFPGSTCWNHVPLADDLEKAFGVRPVLVNDVSAAALGEARSGAWGPDPTLVYFHVGDGIAAGIIIEGRVHRGATGNAGEVGHVIVEPDGPLCYCGNRGCLESVASRNAIVRQCREALEQGVISRVAERVGNDLSALTLRDILAAARDGDRLAGNLLEKAGAHVGRIAANLVNLLNPSSLVLSGIVEEQDSPYMEALRRTFGATVLPPLRRATRIEFARLGEQACILGAAEVVLDRFFASPERLFGDENGPPDDNR